MKNCKWLAVCCALAIALLLSASASHAQVLIGAGSSALFPTMGIAAISGDPVTGAAAVCGTQFWTGGSGAVGSTVSVGRDSRGGGIHDEPGTTWIAWDNDTAPTRVCAFISVDSVVGSRLFLERNVSGVNGSLVLATSVQWTLGGNKVSFAQDSTSCSASGSLTFPSVDLTLTSGTTLSATIHGGGNFSDFISNGAKVTVAGSAVSADNVTNATVGGVTGFTPSSFTYSGAAGAATDTSGSASVTVTSNCPGVPSAVFNMLAANPNFTVGFTDIRPEDGVFAYHRANDTGSFPNDPTFANMDYQGKGILSSYAKTVAFPVNFNLTGADPISGFSPLPSVVVQSIGADPVLIVVNKTDTSTCGLGSTAFTNVTSNALAQAYMGLAGATQDLDPSLFIGTGCTPNAKPLWVVEREPLSGTYNTFEWQVMRPSAFRNRSQEAFNVSYPQSNNNGAACAAWASALPTSVGATTSFPPDNGGGQEFGANNCGNPLNIQLATYSPAATQIGYYGGFGGNRTRAIGTGEMVNVINGGSGGSANTANSLGYAFYSLGTFGGKADVKYVTLDGSDPLYTSYTANPIAPGTIIPACTGFVNTGTFSCTNPQPNFNGVLTGSYKAWEPLHVIYQAPLSTCAAPFTALSIGCLVQAAQDQAANNIKDFVPVQTCGTVHGSCTVTNAFNFFRSHYQNAGPAPHDGNQPTTGSCVGLVAAEAGGDMAGAIFPKQTDFTLQNNVGCGSEMTNVFE